MEESKIKEFSLRRVLTIFLVNFIAMLVAMLVVIPIAQAYLPALGRLMSATIIFAVIVLVNVAQEYLRRKNEPR